MNVNRLTQSTPRIMSTIMFVLSSLSQIAGTQENSALSFDGTGDLVQVPRSSSLEPQSITVEGWAYYESPQPHHTLLLVKSSDSRLGYALHINYSGENDKVHFWVMGKFVSCPWDNKYLYGQWHHYAGTYAGGVGRLYIDGSLVETRLIDAKEITHSPADLFIGRGRVVGQEGFRGVIDEVRIWDYARIEGDIRRDMHRRLFGNENGLVAYYNCDEGKGEVLNDLSPNKNNGTIAGASWIRSTAPIQYGVGNIAIPKNRPSQLPLDWPLVRVEGGQRTSLRKLVSEHKRNLAAYICTSDTPLLEQAFQELSELADTHTVVVVVPSGERNRIRKAIEKASPGIGKHLYATDFSPGDVSVLPRILFVAANGTVTRDQRGWGAGIKECLYAVPDALITATLKTNPSPQYPGEHGGNSLIDGKLGGVDFARREWLGFQGDDVLATIDLGVEGFPIDSIWLNCLQDGIWAIYLPKEVVLWISNDGKEFQKVGAAKHAIPRQEDGPFCHQFAFRNMRLNSRYLRLQASNSGAVPDWYHKASHRGRKSWVFIDEIAINRISELDAKE